MGIVKWGERRKEPAVRGKAKLKAAGMLAIPGPCICRVDTEGHRWLNAGCHVHGGLSSVRAY